MATKRDERQRAQHRHTLLTRLNSGERVRIKIGMQISENQHWTTRKSSFRRNAWPTLGQKSVARNAEPEMVEIVANRRTLTWLHFIIIYYYLLSFIIAIINNNSTWLPLKFFFISRRLIKLRLIPFYCDDCTDKSVMLKILLIYYRLTKNWFS